MHKVKNDLRIVLKKRAANIYDVIIEINQTDDAQINASKFNLKCSTKERGKIIAEGFSL